MERRSISKISFNSEIQSDDGKAKKMIDYLISQDICSFKQQQITKEYIKLTVLHVPNVEISLCKQTHSTETNKFTNNFKDTQI